MSDSTTDPSIDPRITFNTVELQILSLKPDDVLVVKITGDEYDQDTASSLGDFVKKNIPNNKVMAFTVPTGSTIDFTVIRPEAEPYCDDCSCGKNKVDTLDDMSDIVKEGDVT